MRGVIARAAAGPTWTSGSVSEQPGWDEHAAFVDDLVERRIMVMVGPFADDSGSLMLYENVTADEVREWNVFVDELSS